MRSRVMAAIAAAGVALVGCGSSTSSPTGSSSSPSPSPHATALTAAQGKALAAAAILRKSDLPGFAAKTQTEDATDVADERKDRACIGLPPADYLTRNFGTAFTLGNLEIDSSADVTRTTAEAQQELHALTSSKAADCVKASLRSGIESEGGTVHSLTLTADQVHVAGSDATFAYHFAAVASGGGQTLRLSGYEVGSLVGTVEIDISTFATGSTTFSLQDTTALATKATNRVRALS
jgi:hypothetical protein